MLNEMDSQEGTFNSTILVMLIESLGKRGVKDRETMERIVTRGRSTDYLPSVRASETLLSAGDIEGAESILSLSSGSNGVAGRSLVQAKILKAKGDREGAIAAARRSYEYDPSCRDVYSLLAELDPAGAWRQRENIQDIYEGRKPHNTAGEGRLQELYTIYYDWFGGRRNQATDALVSNKWYVSKDPDFLLASARMSMDEMDWHSASRVYSELVSDGAPVFVRVEAAEAALSSGDHKRALDLLSMTDGSSQHVQKLTLKAMEVLGEHDGLMEAIRILLDNESSGSDEYVEMIDMLLSRGADRDAKVILERYSRFTGDDADTMTIRSGMYMRAGDLVSASRTATRAIHMDKNNDRARVQRARVLYAKGNRAEADRECSLVLSRVPDCRGALGLRMDMRMAERDYKGAAEVCRTILSNDPLDVQALIALGICMRELDEEQMASDAFRSAVKSDGSLENSIAVLSAMVGCGMNRSADSLGDIISRQFPEDPMVRRLRGNAQYALGEYLKASVSYSEAAALNPNDAGTWYSKGMADESRGDLISAEEAYDRALTLDQNDVDIWIGKATMREKAGDALGAIQALNRVLELDPRSIPALVRKAVVVSSSGRYADALYYAGQASVLMPDDVRILDLEADLSIAAGDVARAKDVVMRRISKEPSPKLVIRLSKFLVSSDDPTGALAVIDVALRADPASAELVAERDRIQKGITCIVSEVKVEDSIPKKEEPKEDPADHMAMSVSLLSAGDTKGAMRAIDRALSIDPEDPDLYCQKARVALAMGDADGATFLAGNALRTRQNHPGLLLITAEAREAKGDLNGALTQTELAISNGLDTVEVHMIKGRILERMGKVERAVMSYSKACSRDPWNADANLALARQQVASGDEVGAKATLTRFLRDRPDNVPAIVLFATVVDSMDDDEGIIMAYDMLRQCKSVPEESKIRMVRILDDHGFKDEARALMTGNRSQNYDNTVKRNAEKVLRRACATKTTANDPDILDALGFDPDMADMIKGYLEEIPDIGPIVQGGDGFEDMERQSRDVIMKLAWKDLEGNPKLPLERVFHVGGYKDADSARRLVAYVQRAMLSKPGTPNDRISLVAMGLPKGMTVYEIMRQCNLGVYEAVIAASLIVRGQ